MTIVSLDYHQPARQPRSGNWVVPVTCVLAGAVIPITSFVVAWFGCPLSPKWQDGRDHVLIVLQLEGKVAWPFFPLLGYSICCMVLMTFAPARFVSRRLVRLGIYSGIILALQYTIVMAMTLGADSNWIFITIAVAGLVPLGLVVGFWALARSLRPWVLWTIVATLALSAAIVLPPLGVSLRDLFGEAFLVALGAGPLWALEAYSYMSSQVWRLAPEMSQGENRFAAAAPLCWFGGYILTWRLAIYTAMKFYHALPTAQPSGCYVCTAAARGHARFVGARTIRCRDGSLMCVNDQLRHLKLAELALMAVVPNVHRCLRYVYDRIGPKIAARLSHPLAADLAYLSLKPVEWISLVMLRLVIKDPARLASSLLYPRLDA